MLLVYDVLMPCD